MLVQKDKENPKLVHQGKKKSVYVVIKYIFLIINLNRFNNLFNSFMIFNIYYNLQNILDRLYFFLLIKCCS